MAKQGQISSREDKKFMVELAIDAQSYCLETK